MRYSCNRHMAHVITHIAEAKGNVHCRIADDPPVTASLIPSAPRMRRPHLFMNSSRRAIERAVRVCGIE